MDIDGILTTVGGFAQANAQHFAVGAGIIGALVAVYSVRRFVKSREHDDIAANLGVLLFLIVTTEGMWEVVHVKLGVSVPLTIAMFAAFDVVIYSQGATAVKRLKANPQARVGSYLAIIWALSLVASLTVATAGGNLTTQLFRFFSPLVGASLWTQKVLALRPTDEKQDESSWIWTPQRIGVRLGWLKPGSVDDLSDVFKQRKVAALVDTAMELHAAKEAAGRSGAKPGKLRRDPVATASQKLQQLAKDADRETLTAAREQLRIVRGIEDQLLGRADEVSGSDRALLDEVRLTMRAATDRLRADHARAFGPDQPMPALLDQPRTNGVDQLRTSPVDQPRTTIVDQPRTSPADQTTTPTTPVDRPVTSKPVAAERTSRTRKTTARIEADSTVPDRVVEMAKVLRKKYRGDIPSRRIVMAELRWTSAGDAGQAIRLVRNERAKNTP